MPSAEGTSLARRPFCRHYTSITAAFAHPYSGIFRELRRSIDFANVGLFVSASVFMPTPTIV